MSDAKVIFEETLNNGVGDDVKHTVIQYPDGSQVVVSSLLPGKRVSRFGPPFYPETLVFYGDGGTIVNFIEITGERGGGLHNVYVERALAANTADGVRDANIEEQIEL